MFLKYVFYVFSWKTLFNHFSHALMSFYSKMLKVIFSKCIQKAPGVKSFERFLEYFILGKKLNILIFK